MRVLFKMPVDLPENLRAHFEREYAGRPHSVHGRPAHDMGDFGGHSRIFWVPNDSKKFNGTGLMHVIPYRDLDPKEVKIPVFEELSAQNNPHLERKMNKKK